VNRIALYAAINVCFFALVACGFLFGPATNVHPLYLLLLFVICSSPMLDMRQLNDQYAVLGFFSAFYFVLYGALDFSHLIFPQPHSFAPSGNSLSSDGVLSNTELVILTGGAFAHIAYRLICRLIPGSNQRLSMDWPERTLVLWGSILWAVSTWLVWKLNVQILVQVTNSVVADAYSRLNGLQIAAFMLAGYFQPLGIVILAYAQSRYRRPYMMPLLIAMIGTEMVYGFISDSKGQVLIGLALIAITKMLTDGKIPLARLAVLAIIITIAFPILQANRVIRSEYSENHAQAAQQIGKTLERALEAKKEVTTGSDRMDTFLERMSLKDNVDQIVSRTGHDIPFQNGHTLFPLIAVFVPRLVWPTKPDVKTGQLFNNVFNLADSDNVYISTSHLGELYWNYGWSGVIVGMLIIGLLLGLVGTLSNLSQSITITRILVLLATVKLIVLGFESTIATQYSVWVRSIVGIGVMHLLFARQLSSAAKIRSDASAYVKSNATMEPESPFPNLMR